MYRRQPNGKHQLVIPQALVQDIRVNPMSQVRVHPEIKRTYNLISLNYWLCTCSSSDKQNVEKYVNVIGKIKEYLY